MEYHRSDHEEILRIRERHHRIANTITRLNFRVSELEKFRKEYEGVIDKLVDDAAIQKAVKEAVKNERKIYLTNSQRFGAVCLFVIAIADFLRTFNLI